MLESGYVTGTIRRWRDDPAGALMFVRECFGVEPDVWQRNGLLLVSNPNTRRLALKACKGPGKTAFLAWVILWFLATRVESKIGCTSITEANLDTNLWPELYKWMSRSAFMQSMFTWTTTKVSRKGNPNWFAVKRSWPKSGDAQQQADALAGIHADDVMFVLDESGGIPQAVMVTAEAVLANELLPGHRALVLQAGNPTHTSGPLHRACTTDRNLWEVITITGDPDRADRSPRISKTWALEQIASYGRDNPWVMVNVLGEFPPSSINSLLGIEEVERAMRTHYRLEEYSHAQKRLGVDVARFGDDRTVIFPRQGLVAFKPDILRVQRTTTIAARVARAHSLWHPELIFVDDTGHWGHGVIDNLIAASIPCLPINYAEPAHDKRYKTTRDLIWMEMAKWVKAGGALPLMPELVRELTEPTYTFIGGQFVVEPKDQIKARLGNSPDLADALAETFALPEMPGQTLDDLLRGRQKNRTDWDPWERAQKELEEGVGTVTHDWDPLALAA